MGGEEGILMEASETPSVTKEEYVDDVVLDIETAEFERSFGEIDGGWRDLSTAEFLSEKVKEDTPLTLAIGFTPFAAYFSGLTAAVYGLGLQDAAMPFYGVLGIFGGGVASMAAGQRLLENLQSMETDYNQNFEGEYRRLESEDVDSIVEILEGSDQVRYSDTKGIPWNASEPNPKVASRDYSDLIELLEEEHQYWVDEFFLRDFEFLTEEDQHIRDSYDSEELNASDLIKDFPFEKIQRKERELLEQAQQRIEASEIRQYLRWKKVDEPVYEGNAYRLEVYQGEDLQFVVEGITQEDEVHDKGQFVDFIEDV